MARLGPQGFNANEHSPVNPFAPIPAGSYLATIASSETKANRAGTGHYLELRLQVLEGPHRGHSLVSRLNLWHPNPVAVAVARNDLSAICHATGVMEPVDSAQLHDIPLLVDVKVTVRKDNGDRVNEIAGYHAREHQSLDVGPAPWDAY